MMDEGILPWWTQPDIRGAFFRPLAALTHLFDWRVVGHWPVLHHAHSLAWFTAALLAAGAFFREWLGPGRRAALATLLFAVDESHALPAAWVANRNALLVLTFAALAARWTRGRGRGTQNTRRRLGFRRMDRSGAPLRRGRRRHAPPAAGPRARRTRPPRHAGPPLCADRRRHAGLGHHLEGARLRHARLGHVRRSARRPAPLFVAPPRAAGRAERGGLAEPAGRCLGGPLRRLGYRPRPRVARGLRRDRRVRGERAPPDRPRGPTGAGDRGPGAPPRLRRVPDEPRDRARRARDRGCFSARARSRTGRREDVVAPLGPPRMAPPRVRGAPRGRGDRRTVDARQHDGRCGDGGGLPYPLQAARGARGRPRDRHRLPPDRADLSGAPRP